MPRNANATAGQVWVDDPDAPGKRVEVRMMTRGDVVAQMFARGSIDETQREAGGKLAVMFERAESVGYGVIDLARVKVDGGGRSSDTAAAAMQVAEELVEVQTVLGPRLYQILRWAIADGATFVTIARRLFGDRRQQRVVAAMMFLALNDLAVWWGMASGAQADRRREEMRRAVERRQVS